MRTVIGPALAAGLSLAAAHAQPPGPPGPPRPGEVLPAFLQDELALSAGQREHLAAVQKAVDARLDAVLTAAQKKLLRDLRAPGPGRRAPADEDPAPAPTPVPEPRAVPYSPAAVRRAVDAALPVLWKGVHGHTDRRSCFTCHHHAVPLLALTTARARGFAVPAADLAAQVEFVTDWVDGQRDNLATGRGPGPPPTGGGADTTGYALFALDVAGKDPDPATDVLVDYTLGFDRRRDHWAARAARPPSESSSFTTTALAVRGLRRFARAGQRDRADARVAAARGWLERTPAADTEDRVFRLLGLKAAGAADGAVGRAVGELTGTQRPDGGWAQTAGMGSDAYATGSALVALHLGGGVPTADPAYHRGLAYLLGTQLGDGSWLVRTRSPRVQTYFETGFPHGRDQFISSAATGWAAAALALDCPPGD